MCFLNYLHYCYYKKLVDFNTNIFFKISSLFDHLLRYLQIEYFHLHFHINIQILDSNLPTTIHVHICITGTHGNKHDYFIKDTWMPEYVPGRHISMSQVTIPGIPMVAVSRRFSFGH